MILKQINLHNKVLSSDLATLLTVSEDTIRRDLNELAKSGIILKVHGGALSKSFHSPFQQNEVYAIDAKKEVAKKALKLLKNDMVILTGGGTTMLELARMVPEKLQATVFTVSPLVALQLADHPFIDVFLIGGQLSKGSQISIGATVISYLSEIKFDLCLLGTNGIAPQEGITDSDWEIVQVKKAMVRSSKSLAVLCIAEKLNSVQRMKICELNQITHLITELDPADEKLKPYQQQNLLLY
ncbi:DeoR/GlpR family DNA-binding transcription regulator [Mucilaginibacter arboris]|nr:DeoR/GlpR family DNA-binding transcription regulator [Mucilaginibacter arboris]